MPGHFGAFVESHGSAGVIVIPQHLPVSVAVDDLLLIGSATSAEDWATGKLREHLLCGYTLDERRLREKGMGEMEQAVGLARTRLQALWSLIRLSPKLAITSSSPPRAST